MPAGSCEEAASYLGAEVRRGAEGKLETRRERAAEIECHYCVPSGRE